MIRKAKISEIEKIHKLINTFAKKDEMLPKSQIEILENLRDFWVFFDKKQNDIIACGALHFSWYDIVEIKSLAVDEKYQKKHIGKKIIQALLKDAEKFGFKKVFALTYKPNFFLKLGFKTIDKKKLPNKIWFECVKCPKFPECGEVAVEYKIKN